MSVLLCCIFFFFLSFLFYCSSFQSQRSAGFMKNAVFICLSPSVLLFASVIKCCVFISLFMSSVSLCPCPPFTLTKVCSFMPLCDSISLLHCVPLSCHKSKSAISRIANIVFHSLRNHFRHTLSLYCTEAVLAQQFYMATKQCNT